ncbi:unnamed protein product, partial [Ceratitis capitata]
MVMLMIMMMTMMLVALVLVFRGVVATVQLLSSTAGAVAAGRRTAKGEQCKLCWRDGLEAARVICCQLQQQQQLQNYSKELIIEKMLSKCCYAVLPAKRAAATMCSAVATTPAALLR